jgi:hypothetical protein
MMKKLEIGEIIAVAIIVIALSSGFLSAYPSVPALKEISPTTISTFMGGSWQLSYYYSGTGSYSHEYNLQLLGNNELMFENLTDSLGDYLMILYVVFPSHSAAYSYLKNNVIGNVNTINGITYSVYSYGYITMIQIVKNNYYLQLGYIGNSTIIPTSKLLNLANYILTYE